MGRYADTHHRSIAEREDFWRERAALIHWQQPFEKVLDYTRPPFRSWFKGGLTNLCHNAVDRHVAARGGQKALVWISTETNEEKTWTYAQLADEVNAFAAILRSLGVGRGESEIAQVPLRVRLQNDRFLEVREGVLVAAGVEHPDARHELIVSHRAHDGDLTLAALPLTSHGMNPPGALRTQVACRGERPFPRISPDFPRGSGAVGCGAADRADRG